jgi:UDP-N-acetyl-D-glucosamine dehydrogenase
VTPLGALGSRLEERLKGRSATVGVVGLGYVGLPLAVAFARAGFQVIGVDADPGRTALLAGGLSPVEDVPATELAPLVQSGRLAIHSAPDALGEADAIVICVPTPLGKSREPDISFIVAAADGVARVLRPGTLVVLESTTYPGTTDEVLLPRVSQRGLRVGEEFFLGFSPERIDPGNQTWGLSRIPKVVGGVTPVCRHLIETLYRQIIDRVVPVSSTQVAEPRFARAGDHRGLPGPRRAARVRRSTGATDPGGRPAPQERGVGGGRSLRLRPRGAAHRASRVRAGAAGP